jgi:hypothetical protein
MNAFTRLILAGALGIGSTLALAAETAPAATAAPEAAEPEHFLTTEEMQKTAEFKTKDGQVVKRWLGDSLSAANYLKLMVDPVVYHPEATPTPQASQETLDKIAAALTDAERKKFGAKLQLVDTAGPGALKLSTAITGVTIKTEGMKPYEVLPIAAVFGAAKAAGGKRDQDVRFFLETRIVDSVSGEVVGVTMREIKGEDLKGKKDTLQVADVVPAFEKALDSGLESLKERGF